MKCKSWCQRIVLGLLDMFVNLFFGVKIFIRLATVIKTHVFERRVFVFIRGGGEFGLYEGGGGKF